ncbi:helix-turn-helix domain-containing protein [Cytobacillus firmus]|nr:helix-turn-helix domain-containing protein [Cytobacillus firmus]
MTNQQMRDEVIRRIKLRQRLEDQERLTSEDYIAASEIDWTLIGARFRDSRLSCGISISEAARRTGFSESTLRRFEKGNPVKNAHIIECSYKLMISIFDLNTDYYTVLGELIGDYTPIQEAN